MDQSGLRICFLDKKCGDFSTHNLSSSSLGKLYPSRVAVPRLLEETLHVNENDVKSFNNHLKSCVEIKLVD